MRHFSSVESGLQGDSWIWIFDGDEKVSIDSFTSMKHQSGNRMRLVSGQHDLEREHRC